MHNSFSRPTKSRPALLACLAIVLSGCLDAPKIDGPNDPDLTRAAYPDLVPLDPIVAGTVNAATTGQALNADLDARVARLSRRAEALRRADVLGPATRARLLGQLGG